MTLTAAVAWWALAGTLVAVELLTGSFYLLALAVGAAAGALAAHLGMGLTAQVIVSAVVGGGATALWHFIRARSPQPQPAASNRDVLLDIGEEVHVPEWSAEGKAQVQYRGATWTARPQDTQAPQPGRHVITSVVGNQLILARFAVPKA
jgi:membrane protein implicated in regulation of membrane protease activity